MQNMTKKKMNKITNMWNNLDKEYDGKGADLSKFEKERTQCPAYNNPVGGASLPGTIQSMNQTYL